MNLQRRTFPVWLLWALFAVACWGLWAVLSKLIGDALSAAQSQALSTLGLLPVMALLAVRSKPGDPGDSRRGRATALAAGTLTCLANIPYYHAMQMGGKASTVVPLTAMYPLVTILLAVVFLRERFNSVQVGGLVLSLVAIWLFNVAEVSGMLTGWLAYALLPIVMWGVSGLFQKVSTNHISGEKSAFWFLVAFVPVAAGILILEPLVTLPSTRTWVLAVLLGLFFALGNFAILAAFARDGKASVIAPLGGLYPVVSVPIAILFLHEHISIREGVGITFALCAVVALAWEKPASPG